MAVSGRRVTVTTTATRLDTADVDTQAGSRLTLRNADAAVTVDLGASDVTSGAGYGLTAAAVVELVHGSDEAVYGIVAAGTVVVHVFETGV